MPIIPDRLPDPAVRDRSATSPAQRGGAAFERAISLVRQTSLGAPAGDGAARAQVFNEHGFFQPSAASAGDRAAATTGTAAVRRVEAAGATVPVEPTPAEMSAAGERDPMAGVRPAPGPAATVPRAGVAATPASAAGEHLPETIVHSPPLIQKGRAPESREPAARTRSGEAPGRSANTPVAVRATADGVAVSVQFDAPERDRAKLREAILGLLSRHGLRPGHIRITGATGAHQQEPS